MNCTPYFLPMKNTYKYLFFLALFLYSCQNQVDTSGYPLHVGDIAFDENLDNPDFFICNEKRIPQYYAFDISPYKGEKPRIEQYFQEKYSSEGLENENGYITIRFIVNCEGKSGRFRKQEMGLDYVEKKLDFRLSEQLFTLTQQLDGWNDIIHKGQRYDYYSYITFKIIDGKIKEILP